MVEKRAKALELVAFECSSMELQDGFLQFRVKLHM
jgi:hypothetical protein